MEIIEGWKDNFMSILELLIKLNRKFETNLQIKDSMKL